MFDISLIIPTYGRFSEVDKLLQSITAQTYPVDKIEVIIADQNDEIDLSPLAKKYDDSLCIIHEKILEKGSANAKNIGIKISRAPLITFPDDDCMFYEDTVANAIAFFKNNSQVDVVYGKVYDRNAGMNIMRNWSGKEITLNMYNFHLNYSAITCFSRTKELFYDARFGTGAPFFSGDELDYVIEAIKEKYKVVYTNTIDVYHAQLNLSVMPVQKIYKYAIGYGAVCRKQNSFPVFFLFAKSCINQLRLIIQNTFLFNRQNIIKHYNALKGRINGFIRFKENK